MDDVRTNVSFQHPAEFVRFSDEDGILDVSGADWFVSLLHRVPALVIEDELCQEDWGVVVFARRNGMKFWIGLSMWPDLEHGWLAHVHHGSFAWLQRFSSTGKAELRCLVADMHSVLTSDPDVSEITWYRESEMTTTNPRPYTTPTDG